jgi:hypothetical protein
LVRDICGNDARASALKCEVAELILSDVVPKLMVCFRIKEQLTKEIRAHQKTIDEKGLEFQAQGRAYLNSQKKNPIAHDMDVFVTNLLTFFEETLILCMEKFPSGFPIGISEIPEAERNPICPVRFRVAIAGIPNVQPKSNS